MAKEHDIHHRALEINLDPGIYGTFAEIGAGQEVARWFLRVGGASGTVAKTVSAYDMKLSDIRYGEGSRYVSRDRLLSMLDHEYKTLLESLDAARGGNTRFFVFADTVAARNFAGTNECHGWMGVRFQAAPRSEPSEVLLHVNMRDPTNLLQQQALGVLGVNLIHSAFQERDAPDALLDGIFTDLSLDRIEIDVVELHGPAFADGNPCGLGVKLVRKKMAQAVLFQTDRALVQPSSVLRKRPLVIERGMYHHVETLHHRLLKDACAALCEEIAPEREPLAVPELSVNPITGREAPDEAETLRRLDEIFTMDDPVLLSRFPEVYHLTAYLRRYTREPMRFVLGASTVVQLMHRAHYADLMGGMLEALGHLFARDVKIYVYPMKADAFRGIIEASGVAGDVASVPAEGFITADSIRLDPPLDHLYRYLCEAGWIAGLSPPD